MDKLEKYLDALGTVLGKSEQIIPLHQPLFVGNEWDYVKSCLDSGWVSSVGEYVSKFENKISEVTGIPYAIAVVNGTAALHICLHLMGVSKDDEVLLPSLTFVATANAVTYCQAIPHFIDSDPSNLGIDIFKLNAYLEQNTYIKNQQCINKNTNRTIKAIIPVHIFGHPVDMDDLKLVCDRFHLKIIEDASESLGSYYKGKHTGHFSDVSCLSFNGNKVITTGGGGAILTFNEDLAKKAKHLTTTAKKNHRWEFFHDEIGYNYRLPNINAALGCAQLEQLPTFIENKRKLAKIYYDVFSNFEDVIILQESPHTKCNYWLNALILNTPDRNFIENLIESAHKQNYGLRGLWTPLDLLPMYKEAPKMDLQNTYELFNRVIALPSSANLGVLHG